HRGARARLALLVVARAAGHRVDLREYFLGDVRLRVHALDAVSAALQPPEIAVAAGMHETLYGASVLREIDQERCGDLVPVPRIVPVVLVIAADLARVHVEREHGGGVEIVAGPHVAHPRRAVAGSPVAQIELGLVVRGETDRHAAGLPGIGGPRIRAGLAGTGDRIRLPGGLAVGDVEGRDVAADAELAARGADHHLA